VLASMSEVRSSPADPMRLTDAQTSSDAPTGAAYNRAGHCVTDTTCEFLHKRPIGRSPRVEKVRLNWS
jgi:hypothetical protein